MPRPPQPPHPIDAVTTDGEAINALNAAGYTNVSDLTRRGNGWLATAINPAGNSCQVILLAKDGRVSEELGSLESEES